MKIYSLTDIAHVATTSIQFAKERTIVYAGRAVVELKYLPVSMRDSFPLACTVTAVATAAACFLGNLLGKKVSSATKSPVADNLTFAATLAVAYTGLSYATRFPQNNLVSALIVISLTAIRCLKQLSDSRKENEAYKGNRVPNQFRI